MTDERAEMAELIRGVVDRIERDGIDNEIPGSPAWCHDYTEALADVLHRAGYRKGAGGETVARAFSAWAMKNEITEPPLDWAWFGEIMRRYLPEYERDDEVPANESEEA